MEMTSPVAKMAHSFTSWSWSCAVSRFTTALYMGLT
jgi:hypothetical protein